MALTPAEKMKRYREKLKKDDERYKEYKKKNLQRLKLKNKKITELNKNEMKEQRKKWRDQKRKQKDAAPHASTSQPSNASNSKHAHASTSKHSNASTSHHSNASTSQRSNSSTSQHSNASTSKHSNASTSQHSKASTSKHSNASTSQHSNASTSQHSKATTKRSCPVTDDDESQEKSEVTDNFDSTHEGYNCSVCSGSIVGSRYVCVQCAHYTLCASCEARGEHSLHYVLRIPRLARNTEVDAVLSKIRADLLYGLDTEQAEQGTDDGVVPTLQEDEIKVEIKEEFPDPLELEDAVQPDELDTESELKAEPTSTEHVLVNTSTTILTDELGNCLIIENPVKVAKSKPKKTKQNITESEIHYRTEKRMKMSMEETEASVVTAGSSREGANGSLRNLPTKAKAESFQVFAYDSKKTPAQTLSVTNTRKIMALSSSKKKEVHNHR